MNKSIGLYLHIPFCRSRCPYCDFYSLRADDSVKENYVTVLTKRTVKEMSERELFADTLYIGGGTPSVLGAKSLSKIVEAASPFLTKNAEITVECNPFGLSDDFFKELYDGGVNRISMGLQSANDRERRSLGRLSNSEAVKDAVLSAQKAGIYNISLDVMLGVPHQTEESLSETLDFCISLDIPHISTYILKLEEGTLFYNKQNELSLPSDDEVAEMYLQTGETLKNAGIYQYEISNHAKEGFQSRHNLKYWNCEEYLGLGPSAHSFLRGNRFYFPRDINSFLNGDSPVFDGTGGDFTEYAMLRLRLSDGLQNRSAKEKYGHEIPKEILQNSEKYINADFMKYDGEMLKFTEKGFLVSNTILAEIL